MTQQLGILGGGQLGRMLALAARPLGLEIEFIDPQSDAPAKGVARQIEAPYEDRDALSRLGRCDWITFEFENIPEAAAKSLTRKSVLFPPVKALRVAQDRWTEKSLFAELGIETASFLKVDSLADAEQAFDKLGPIVLKTRRLGYDGKGQAVARSKDEIASAFDSLEGAPAIAEELIQFDRELSIIICRGQDGSVEIYPIIENSHKDGVLRRSTAPAPGLSESLSALATKAASDLVDHLSYVGVLALELFQVGDRLLANEFAPRVHNSGHWTIEGAVTSQFENHVRAVCGFPLGSAKLRCPAVMINLLGRVPPRQKLLSLPDTHLHDYGKEARPGRKVGHVTCLAPSAEEAKKRAKDVEVLLDSQLPTPSRIE